MPVLLENIIDKPVKILALLNLKPGVYRFLLFCVTKWDHTESTSGAYQNPKCNDSLEEKHLCDCLCCEMT